MTSWRREIVPSLPSYIELCAQLPHSKKLDGDGSFVVPPLIEKSPFGHDCLQRLASVTNAPEANEDDIREWKKALTRLYTPSDPKTIKTLARFSSSLPEWFANTPSIRAILKMAKRLTKKDFEEIIGKALVSKIDTHEILPCTITRTLGYSKLVDKTATLFRAYLNQTGEKIGKCSFRIVSPFSAQDCEDTTYCTQPVTGIIRIDSFARKTIKGTGTVLMQAAMEDGIRRGTGGRIMLHAVGPALGFYYKLGMRPPHSRTDMEEIIQEELRRASKERCESADVLRGDALCMYLPPEGIQKWAKIIRINPILSPSSQKTTPNYPYTWYGITP